VRADECPLQLLATIGRDMGVRERAETGRDAVDRLVGGREPRHHRGALLHPAAALRPEPNGSFVAGDGDHLLGQEADAVQLNHLRATSAEF